MTSPAAPSRHTSPEQVPLTHRELALIAAFWGFYASLNFANRLFEQGGPDSGSTWRALVVAGTEPLIWALLTPALFVLAARFDTERTHRTETRALQLVVLALVGVAIAGAMAWLGSELRGGFGGFGGGRRMPRPLGPNDLPFGPPRGPRRGGPPVWFGVVNALVTYLGIVAAGLARAYSLRYRARREQATRLETQLAEARLDALRRQLDPHFLFNTLNAVSALVERDPRGVRRMIARLSDLLRHSFEGGGDAETPLRDELALLGRYVDIMQVRFQGRLAVDMQIDARTLVALVPTFILQPLVENAIKHGIEGRTEPGRIEIVAALEGGVVVLRVHDDGPGPDSAPTPIERGGVGLRNTRARLRELYGDAARFALDRDPRGGTVAEIRLPYHVTSEMAASRPGDSRAG
jgi:signal transduction histidine kinase